MNHALLAVLVALLSWSATAEAQCASWIPTDGPLALDAQVFALTTWDPDGAGPQEEVLVAGGAFSTAGGVTVNRIATWDGLEWKPIGTGITETAGRGVFALAVHNGQLIAGGLFSSAGGVAASNIARWNGSSWEPLGTGVDGDVFGMTVYQGDLIVVGRFLNAGGILANRVARWDGKSWHAMSTGCNGVAHGCGTYANSVYVGGLMSSAGGHIVHQVAAWDGTDWRSPGGGITGNTGVNVNAFAEYAGELICCGFFDYADGRPASNIARWNGSYWAPLGTGLSFWGNAALPFGDSLIVGGQFIVAGGVSARHIASWNGKEWSPVGSGVDRAVNALAQFHGELVVGGGMRMAGDVPCEKWARWTPSGAPWIVRQPVDATTSCGSEVVFSTSVALGYGGLEYQWRKCGIALADDGRIIGANTRSLAIAHLNSSDAGGYDCIVTSGCAEITSRAATLVVMNIADFDHDTFVTGSDFDLYVAAYEAKQALADIDGDGFVTGVDFDLYVQAFDAGCRVSLPRRRRSGAAASCGAEARTFFMELV